MQDGRFGGKASFDQLPENETAVAIGFLTSDSLGTVSTSFAEAGVLLDDKPRLQGPPCFRIVSSLMTAPATSA
jgi:hypothetical protein